MVEIQSLNIFKKEINRFFDITGIRQYKVTAGKRRLGKRSYWMVQQSLEVNSLLLLLFLLLIINCRASFQRSDSELWRKTGDTGGVIYIPSLLRSKTIYFSCFLIFFCTHVLTFSHLWIWTSKSLDSSTTARPLLLINSFKTTNRVLNGYLLFFCDCCI